MPSRAASASSRRTFSTVIQSSNKRSRPQHVSSRSLVQSALNIESHFTSTTPPTFLFPSRANLHQAVVTQAESPSAEFQAASSELPPTMLQPAQRSTAQTGTGSSTEVASPTNISKPLVLSKSLQQLLPVLEAQRPHYITAHIHRFPYLLQAGDTLRLPFHMHGVEPGDILRFNRASILGSRDYTLKAGTTQSEYYDQKRTGEPNYLDERLFECRARVLGVDSQPMMLKEKTKRRNRKVKTVKSKHRYTMLKIMDVKIKTLEELRVKENTLLLE